MKTKIMQLRNEPKVEYRERCYVCFRPVDKCFCDVIPSIDNKTHILILQHVKERFHPFNTARIVRKALQNSELIVDQTAKLATASLPFRQNTGVLFPGQGARLLSDVPADERPEQLVIIDGTWHHAKTFMNQIPVLQQLPKFCLKPETPSTYRIRKEPTETALSTLEATVAALRDLEPETQGFDQLIGAFDTMIDAQILSQQQSGRERFRTRPWSPQANIPSIILGGLENVVVVYGEAAHGNNDTRSKNRKPIYWVAQRLGTNEAFECAIRPDTTLCAEFLQHLQLESSVFTTAADTDEFVSRWRTFLRPTDTVVAFNDSTLRLLRVSNAEFVSSIALKAVDLKLNSSRLDDIVQELELVPEPVNQKGRAGLRLANAIAFCRYLQKLGIQNTES